MGRLDYPKLIHERVRELSKLEKQQSNGRLRLRVQMLRLLKSGEVSEVKDASRLLGISAKHGYQLWHRYRASGLSYYLKLAYKPKVSKLKSAAQVQLIKQAQAVGFNSQGEARAWIEQQFGHSYTQQGVSLLFQRFRIKAKTARPDNILGQREARVEDKKSLPKD